MVSIRKRGAVYGVIGLMLCVAVYLNWSYFQTPEEMTVANQAAEDVGSVYGEVTAVDKETADAAGSDAADSGTAEKADNTDYFAQARLSRQTARDEALSMLKETVASEDAAEGAKQDASDQITSIAGDMVREERIESQIKAKGYADAVVYITTETISVVVSSPENGLQAADAATISDIIVSETGADPSVIRISEAK